MSSRSIQCETIDIPSTTDQPAPVPFYDVEDYIRSALQDLRQGDLLQLVVDHMEALIEFVSLTRNVTPESLAQHLESADPTNVAFYQYPGSHTAILIWTRYLSPSSAKRNRVQSRLRRDLAWYAGEEGVKNIVTFAMQSRRDVTVEKLKEACIGIA